MFSVNATPICGDQKTVRGMLVTFDDVTAIEEKNTQLEHTVRQLNEAQERVKKQNEELRRMATRDGLTGVFNRRSFQVQFASLFEDSTRTGKPLSLIMVDIDHFKSVNDKHGHAKGDAVLQQVAQFLLEGAGPSDVVARYGGEEFCILLPDSTASAAFQVAEQIRANLSNDQIAGLDITASFGVCGTETTCDNELQLAHFADEALYFSKRNGRDRVSNYSQIAALIESPDATEYKTRPSIPNEAVSALISALHFRDPLTAQHSRRVSALCVEALAGAIDQHDLKVLEVAALLHDIGKIGVPDSILLKPGPLNDEERQLMDTHDRIGIAILESSFKHEEIAAIVRAHHAHFDGSGARCGAMRGAEIPLRARILSIADAYDAMTDDRPYRNAMSRDLAIAELKRCAGTQFDPILVDRFVAFIEQSERPSMQQSVIDMTLRLGLEVERLTAAVERQELMLARAVAQRLQALSTSVGHAGMATAAAKVANALSRNLDAQTVSSEVRNLLNSYSAYCEMVTVSQQIAA